VLHLSEHAAYSRIETARAARRFPTVIDLLVEGAITLTTVTLLAPHLTADNHCAVLEAARHKSKREVEEQVAALRPLPPVPSSVRRLPDRHAGAPLVTDLPGNRAPVHVPVPIVTLPPAVVRPPVVRPLAVDHYKVQFTISRDTHDKLRRAQDLLRHSIPDGDIVKIFEKALSLLLADAEKKKLAATLKPRDDKQAVARSSRHIPASVKRAVWKRDDGRCAFIGRNGRCDEHGFLEFHHREPFAAGGATTVDNLELRCRAHNAYEAELFFGPFIAREESADFRVERTRSGPS
jgi:hypothetical protein